MDATALAAVAAGLDPVAEMFAERHDFARIRSGIVEANPELQERELIKLQNLAGAIKAALIERDVSANAAILAAQAGVTVFHVAFARRGDGSGGGGGGGGRGGSDAGPRSPDRYPGQARQGAPL